MKKMILLMAAATTLAHVADAQNTKKPGKTPKVFARIGLGYALGSATTDLQSQTTNTTTENKYSNGAGLNLKAAVGYQWLPNVAFELGLHYGIAPKSTTEIYSDASQSYTYKYKAKNPFYVIPSIVICTNTEPFDVYTRVGVVVPVLGRTEINSTYVTASSPTSASQTIEQTNIVKSGFNVGFQGALGVKYTITRRFKVWAEVEGIMLSRWAKSGELKKYDVNGQDQLGTLYVSDKQTTYVKSYDHSVVQTGQLPSIQSTFAIPYSSIGLNLGVAIGL